VAILNATIAARPGGEIGRHNGLKIRRLGKTSVPVRFRFRAPELCFKWFKGVWNFVKNAIKTIIYSLTMSKDVF
jgi:hypothetical protein